MCKYIGVVVLNELLNFLVFLTHGVVRESLKYLISAIYCRRIKNEKKSIVEHKNIL